MMVSAAKMMVTIQKRMVIFDSWKALCGFFSRYLHSGSNWLSWVRKLSWIGVRLKMRCLMPLRLPSL